MDVLVQPFDVLGNEVDVSGSIGVAFYPFDAQIAEDLIKWADEAMHQSENNVRNRYTYFHPPQKPSFGTSNPPSMRCYNSAWPTTL